MTERRPPRSYTDEFKEQLVQLYQNRKRKCDICREYDIANSLLDETLDTFHIKRSLSMKGCPYDNAVAEATLNIIKKEFVKGQSYVSLEQLQYELSDYVNWFNNHRTHSSLGYLTPKEYRLTNLKKVV